MTKFNTEKWLEKARMLDPEALTELYEYYYPKVYKFVYYRTNSNEADDLTGEIFLKVMKAISRQSGSLDAWIFRIARNTVVDFFRRRDMHSEVELTDAHLETIPDKENMHKKIENKIDILQALDKVNDEYREFLTLKFIAGLSNDELAEITGKTHGALRAMQFRALKALNSGV